MNKIIEIEKRILKFWEKNNTFQKSLQKKSPYGDFVFYDGPPFATGTPHYGHILASTIKDVIPRYKTMKGLKVERKWGWDCHGLPLENLIEKELGIKTKTELLKFGIENFNKKCKTSVLRYAEIWKKVIKRLARWVDIENAYLTMDNSYIESCFWVFKELYKKGLIYKGKKSAHICPRCETVLSNFEVSQGYKDIEDFSIIVKFKLKSENRYLLAWTTTPWTLPGNTALALNPNAKYIEVESENEIYILAEKRLSEVFKGKNYKILKTIENNFLLGKNYEPLFDYFKNTQITNKDNLYKIVSAEFVSLEEGTGIVHIAPAFGEEDYELAKRQNLAIIQHIKMNGRFKSVITDFSELQAKNADFKIIEFLKNKGLLFKSEKIKHSYPHCWRCDTKLLNFLVDSWFVNVEKIKQDLIKNNEKINWVPSYIKTGRFGKWLLNAKDWAISRQRFWGAPIPVWECETCGNFEIIGSIKEIKEKMLNKIELTDLHRPYIDKIILKCSKCKGKAKRIQDVFDCWFESGSMPYGSFHYPFENKEKFEKNFPAEFIAEGIDQTRGWFYTLLVLSTALFNQPAYKNVIVNGIILAEDGKKMSKRLKNYPDPEEIFEKYGVDALRLYLLSSPVVRGETINFSEKRVKEVMQNYSLLLHNILNFYTVFKLKDEINSQPIPFNILDKWIVSKFNSLVKKVDFYLEKYELMYASRLIKNFVLDFSKWYLRRSRERFKQGKGINIFGFILIEFSKLIAPFTPYIAEYIYQTVLDNFQKSVHLENYPVYNEKLIDNELEAEMELAQKLCEKLHFLRKKANIKVRQPLSKAYLKTKFKNLEIINLIKDEINVKTLDIVKEFPKDENIKIFEDVALDIKITEELKAEGIKRELIRFINNFRKLQGLTPKDIISIKVKAPKEYIIVLERFKKEILDKTLISDIKTEISEKLEILNV